MKPRQELCLSKGCDLLTDYPVKNALIIMENSSEDADYFLNMLDEVYTYYTEAIITEFYICA